MQGGLPNPANHGRTMYVSIVTLVCEIGTTRLAVAKAPYVERRYSLLCFLESKSRPSHVQGTKLAWEGGLR